MVMLSLLGVTPGHLKSQSCGKASNGCYAFLGWMHGPRPLPLLSTFPRWLPAARCITVQLRHAGTWPWLWVPACLVFIPPPRNALCFVLGAFPWLQGRDGGSKERSVSHAAVAAAILFCSVAMPPGATDSPGASASSWEMCFLMRRGSFELLFHPFHHFSWRKPPGEAAWRLWVPEGLHGECRMQRVLQPLG